MKANTLTADQQAHGPGPRPKAVMSTRSAAGKKLLLVEDDLCMREITELFLNENGYACTTSENAVRAIDRLQHDHFDLVITDLHMPDMDGMALVDWIKPRLPQTKVMMMTGDSDLGLKVQALKRGVVNYLVKPFTLEKFLQEIEGSLTTPSRP